MVIYVKIHGNVGHVAVYGTGTALVLCDSAVRGAKTVITLYNVVSTSHNLQLVALLLGLIDSVIEISQVHVQ